MPMSFNLRHLRAFISVAEAGSATRASEHLCRAQSAVTRSVHELESYFGVELFERKATGMLCNAFGGALLYRGRRAIHELEQGVAEVASKSADPQARARTRVPAALLSERRLAILVNLAKHGHMPTVAKLLGISQPAVSAGVNDLEGDLGVALFRRTSKGVVATEPGVALLFRVKRALMELRHVEAELGAIKGATEGKVVIGALPLGRTQILPNAILAVLSRHPLLRIETIEAPFDTLANRLRAGDIDFIFGALRPADYARDLKGEPLLNDSMSIVVRNGHPLGRRKNLGLQDLDGLSWVLANPHTPARRLFSQSFCLQGLTPPAPAVETSDLALLRGLLLRSDMATAISARQLEFEIGNGTLQALDISLPSTTRVIGLIQRAESKPSPGASALMAAIRDVVAEIRRPKAPAPQDVLRPVGEAMVA